MTGEGSDPMPDRLNNDPIVRIVEDLDRSRRWVAILAFLVGCLIVAVVVLGFAFRDLTNYIKQPTGRGNRLTFQCEVERRLHLPEDDCDA